MDSKKTFLTDQELEKLANFLQKKTGVELEDSKLHRFQRKIEDVFLEHDINDFNSFYHRIRYQKDEDLIQDLTNAVTVNETYFWREFEQFSILTQKILPQFIQSNKIPIVRILVAPCSSGEELYSIMLAILDTANLLEKLNIELVGIDIDSKMVFKAKAGLYTQRSVKKLPKHLLKTYFTKVGNLYKIDDALRKNSYFIKANIFDDSIIEKFGHFDILFSRNMLIYFNELDKQKCYNIFYKILNMKGFLFLGHADANGINKKLFLLYEKGFHIYQKI